MAHPSCSVFIGASLDGFIARRDGGLDWLHEVERPGEDYGFGAFFSGVDTLLVGRRTYEVALGFPEWPYAGKHVAVWTRRDGTPRHGETFVSGAPTRCWRPSRRAARGTSTWMAARPSRRSSPRTAWTR